MNFISKNCRLLLGAAAMTVSLPLMASDFPSKPIQIIVPYAAGGSTDLLARAIQDPMSKELGQNVIILNKPGAGGTIGADHVVRADPDGYTLVFGNTGPNAIVHLTRKVTYDPVADLQPISTVAITPMILAVPAKSSAKTLDDFIAYAKEKGDTLNFGSTGNGGISHLSGAYFNQLAGTQMVHVPYNGGSPMLPAFAEGQLDAAFLTGLDGTNMLASGLIRYLAVGTPTATDVAPGLPAISESVPTFKSIAWFGLLAPKGTPDEIIEKINRAVSVAVETPSVRKMFTDRWVEPRSSTPEELASIIQEEIAQWGPVAKEANLQF